MEIVELLPTNVPWADHFPVSGSASDLGSFSRSDLSKIQNALMLKKNLTKIWLFYLSCMAWQKFSGSLKLWFLISKIKKTIDPTPQGPQENWIYIYTHTFIHTYTALHKLGYWQWIPSMVGQVLKHWLKYLHKVHTHKNWDRWSNFSKFARLINNYTKVKVLLDGVHRFPVYFTSSVIDVFIWTLNKLWTWAF